jgi:hypothetical protein
MTYVLWTLQALLALAFLFAGGMKLVMPIEMLTEQSPLPGLFIRVVGVLEVAGALGLILPGLFKIKARLLTPLAAVELAQVMLAAAVLTLATTGDYVSAAIPLAIGVLLAGVAAGRYLTPRRPSAIVGIG